MEGIFNPCYTDDEFSQKSDAEKTDGRVEEEGPRASQATTEDPEAESDDLSKKLMYAVDDSPPWYLCIIFGMQHYLMMLGGLISIPFILAPLMCIDPNDPARAYIVSTVMFVSGLITLLQSTFGVRLPIIQGTSFAFLMPALAILNTSFEPCENLDLGNMTEAEREELWEARMRMVQGSIAVASSLQILIGFSGLLTILVKWITPLTIVPTITLIALSLFDMAASKAALHWGISSLTTFLLILFSQYLKNVGVPYPSYNRSTGHIAKANAKIFQLFPVLLGIMLSWALCGVLTATGVLEEDNPARTDLTTDLMRDTPWFRFPYPGQWGVPTVSAAGVLGMMAGVIASVVESIGDYYACAALSGAPPLPTHALNRGIMMEGVGCLLAGLWGTGSGTTSYSENIGAIGITRVGSRRVIQTASVILLVFGMVGKVGAVFVSMPEPIVGGVFFTMFAMIVGIGLSPLQHVNLNSSRNLFVLGFSLFIGLAIPKWSAANPDAIKTGVDVLDQIFTVLLQTSMFVGGLFGFFLDNTMPGTKEERGIISWNDTMKPAKAAVDHTKGSPRNTYDLPFGMSAIRRAKWTKYIPFCPTFRGFFKED